MRCIIKSAVKNLLKRIFGNMWKKEKYFKKNDLSYGNV